MPWFNGVNRVNPLSTFPQIKGSGIEMLPLAIWAERFRFELLASCWNHSQSRQNDAWLQTSSSQWFRPQKGSKLQWIVWNLLELIQISHKIHLYEPLCWRGCWVVTSWYGSQWLRCGGGVGGADKNALQGRLRDSKLISKSPGTKQEILQNWYQTKCLFSCIECCYQMTVMSCLILEVIYVGMNHQGIYHL